MRAWMGLALGVAMLAVPQAASAEVSVVVGAGVPVYPVYRHHHRPPPVVVYGAPPPAVVYAPAPPPAVVYAPAPPPAVVYAPAPSTGLSANPASPVYTAPNGQTCREYQTTVIVDRVAQPAYGTACLQPDGSWRTVN